MNLLMIESLFRFLLKCKRLSLVSPISCHKSCFSFGYLVSIPIISYLVSKRMLIMDLKCHYLHIYITLVNHRLRIQMSCSCFYGFLICCICCKAHHICSSCYSHVLRYAPVLHHGSQVSGKVLRSTPTQTERQRHGDMDHP